MPPITNGSKQEPFVGGRRFPFQRKRYFVVFVLRLRNIKEAMELARLRSFGEEVDDPKESGQAPKVD